MDLTFQPARQEDLEALYTLTKELIELYEDQHQVDSAKIMAWVHRKLEIHIQEYTSIFSDGKKAGYYHFFAHDGHRMELDDLYVFPSYRSRGIGTAVIQKCCAETNQPILLYVFQNNTRALALYQKLGFQIQCQTSQVSNTRLILQRD